MVPSKSTMTVSGRGTRGGESRGSTNEARRGLIAPNGSPEAGRRERKTSRPRRASLPEGARLPSRDLLDRLVAHGVEVRVAVEPRDQVAEAVVLPLVERLVLVLRRAREHLDERVRVVEVLVDEVVDPQDLAGV